MTRRRLFEQHAKWILLYVCQSQSSSLSQYYQSSCCIYLLVLMDNHMYISYYIVCITCHCFFHAYKSLHTSQQMFVIYFHSCLCVYQPVSSHQNKRSRERNHSRPSQKERSARCAVWQEHHRSTGALWRDTH